MDPLHIVLVESASTLREGLRAFLEGHDDVGRVAVARSLEEALRARADIRAAVALVGVDPAGESLGLVEALADGAGIPVVVLAAAGDPGTVRRAMRAGALGYLLNDAHHAELIEALRAARGGKRFVCGGLARPILAASADGAAVAAGANPEAVRAITDREREVLTRIALGQSNKRSARELGLSVKTVEKHRSNLMRKLNLHNTAAVTMFALRHGLVREEDAQTG